MNIVASIAFLAVSSVFILLTVLMLLRIGFGRLESRLGIERDGPKRGLPAPAWSLPDLNGGILISPSGTQWQLLLFADHSLASFPALVTAINRMHAGIPDLEVIVLTRRTAKLDERTAEDLGIRVPIVLVDQAFYERFNVRVMPYGIYLDSQGTVRWAGLANYEPQLLRELRLARENGSAPAETIAAEVPA